MSSFVFGSLAALSGPLVTTVGLIFWENNWNGSTFALNMLKCNVASVALLVVSVVSRVLRHGDEDATVFPPEVFTLRKTGFLFLSSTLGILVGDFVWLESLRLLGTRRVIVVDSMKPFLAAFLGRAILAEQLRPPAFGGMALTVLGVMIVSFEREKKPGQQTQTQQPDARDDSTALEPQNDGQNHHHDSNNNQTHSNTGEDTDIEEDRFQPEGEDQDENDTSCVRFSSAESSDPAVSAPTSMTMDGIGNRLSLLANDTLVEEPVYTNLPAASEEENGANGEANTMVGDKEGTPVKENGTHNDQFNDEEVCDDENNLVNGEPSPEAAAVTEEEVVATSARPPQRGIQRSASLRESRAHSTSSLRRGYLFSVMNIILDTYGSVLTKQFGVGMAPWEISLLRFGFAGFFMLVLSFVLTARDAFKKRSQSEQRSDEEEEGTPAATPFAPTASSSWYHLPRHVTYKSWMQIMAGIFFVTFVTPALSNYAIFQIALALALTLSSIGPLYALPLTWWLQGDRPSLRATVGAALAVGGVVLLSFFGTLKNDDEKDS